MPGGACARIATRSVFFTPAALASKHLILDSVLSIFRACSKARNSVVKVKIEEEPVLRVILLLLLFT